MLWRARDAAISMHLRNARAAAFQARETRGKRCGRKKSCAVVTMHLAGTRGADP
jgi:hypothetical protein